MESSSVTEVAKEWLYSSVY